MDKGSLDGDLRFEELYEQSLFGALILPTGTVTQSTTFVYSVFDIFADLGGLVICLSMIAGILVWLVYDKRLYSMLAS